MHSWLATDSGDMKSSSEEATFGAETEDPAMWGSVGQSCKKRGQQVPGPRDGNRQRPARL